MVRLVVSLLLPWFFAYVLLRRCDPDARGTGAARWLHACLAVGIGLGLSSCTYFIWLFCFGPPGRVFWVSRDLGLCGRRLARVDERAGCGLPGSLCRPHCRHLRSQLAVNSCRGIYRGAGF